MIFVLVKARNFKQSRLILVKKGFYTHSCINAN